MPNQPGRSRPPAQRSLTVLVADDEPILRKAIKRLLERRGHQVHAVDDAYQALASLAEGSYDAVMVDAQMPGGGQSVLRHLEESGFPGMVVLMTGGIAADAVDVSDGVRRLQKPFPFPSIIPLLEGSPLH